MLPYKLSIHVSYNYFLKIIYGLPSKHLFKRFLYLKYVFKPLVLSPINVNCIY